LRYNQGRKTKAAEATERSRRRAAKARESSGHTALAVAEMSGGAADAREDLLRRGDGSHGHKHIRLGGELDDLAVFDSSTNDDMRTELDRKDAMIDDLVKLLEKSDTSVDRATSLVEKLMEENNAWKKSLEKKSASKRRLKELAEELLEDLAKLYIEREGLLKESVERVKELHVYATQSINSLEQRACTMAAMRKMSDERREEMEVVEAMKKEIEELRAQQSMKN